MIALIIEYSSESLPNARCFPLYQVDAESVSLVHSRSISDFVSNGLWRCFGRSALASAI